MERDSAQASSISPRRVLLVLFVIGWGHFGFHLRGHLTGEYDPAHFRIEREVKTADGIVGYYSIRPNYGREFPFTAISPDALIIECWVLSIASITAWFFSRSKPMRLR